MPDELEQGHQLETEESAEPEAPETVEAADDEGGEQAKPQGDLNKALRSEREAHKQLKEKVKGLEQAATNFQRLSPYLNDPRVINSFKLAAGMVAAGQGAAETDDPEVSAFVEEINAANSMGPDGVKKFAKSLLTRVSKAATEAARQAAAPVAAQSTSDRARAMVTAAYNVRDPEGRLYAKREFIDQEVARHPEGVLANPKAMEDILNIARGRGGAGEAALSAPLYTETPGRAPLNKKSPLTELDRSVMKELGRSEKDYRSLLDGIEITDQGAVLE